MSRSTLAVVLRHLRAKLACQEQSKESDEQLLHTFLASRDDSAFAVLVRRYGSMVLRVCRRVLGHEQDAEDAFQATFLVLAQKAGRLRDKTALASFLHGTAYRIAMKAKQTAARRRKHEGQAPARPPVDPTDELSWREVRALVDEEVARLPEKYRSAFILCCLENVSQQEAAQRLGIKEGTVSSRLARARKRLVKQLSRRGVDLATVLTAMGLATQTASALPAGLMATTIETALMAASGEKLAGIISASVAQLAESATAAVVVSKAKIAVMLLLTASMLAGASVWTHHISTTNSLVLSPLPAEESVAQADNKPRTASPKRATTEAVEIQGRVVNPDGKPVRGAKLLFLFGFRFAQKQIPNKVWAKSDAEGRFRFTVPVDRLGEPFLRSPWKAYVLAAADGYGFAVAPLDKPGATDLMLRLVKDDLPIRGRILSLEGKPIAGARVRIANALYVPKKDDLTTWLAAVKAGRKETDRYSVDWLHLIELYNLAFDSLIPSVTTGRDGRFQIEGIGRERLAHLRIEGPTIATQIVTVQTHSDEAIHYQWADSPKRRIDTYYGAALEILAAPARSVQGVVRDKDTGKPLAGVMVETEVTSSHEVIRTTTDKDGHYRLDGLTKGGHQILAMTDDMPYLPALRTVEDSLGLEAVTFNIALKRGVWIKGRVFDKATGKPHWADVEYHCFRDNPNRNEMPSRLPYRRIKVTRKDGSFRIVALPGRGLITAFAIDDSSDYVTGVGADKIKGFDPLAIFPGGRFLLMKKHTLIEINPKPGDEPIIRDMALDPGRTLAGRIVGPDGKPLAGARACGLSDRGDWEMAPLPGAEFTVKALQPNKPRLLQFVHEGKKLSGFLRLRGDEKGTFQVRLERYGTLIGRLVTPDGKPMTRAEVVYYTSEKQYSGLHYESFQPVQLDKSGRFSIEGLAPGLKYELFFIRRPNELEIVGGRPKELTIESGETKDLGDLIVKPKK